MKKERASSRRTSKVDNETRSEIEGKADINTDYAISTVELEASFGLLISNGRSFGVLERRTPLYGSYELVVLQLMTR